MAKIRKTLSERFWRRVEKGDGCWTWKSSHFPNGYASLHLNKNKWLLAHRLAYQLIIGEIPSGLIVMHLCDNRGCVRPDHLRLGTQTDNMHDASMKGRLPGGTGQEPGEAHAMARLTANQIREIRETYSQGGISQRILGIRYGVCQTHIGQIVRRQTWKCV
jgi:hypothetical protein